MTVLSKPHDKERIRQLNDSFRQTLSGGVVLMTPGVRELNQLQAANLLKAVREFKDFDDDEAPYAEHNFGAVEIDGDQFFWKIDYYDLSMEYHSPDEADPAVTTRVLTIMRAEEY